MKEIIFQWKSNYISPSPEKSLFFSDICINTLKNSLFSLQGSMLLLQLFDPFVKCTGELNVVSLDQDLLLSSSCK